MHKQSRMQPILFNKAPLYWSAYEYLYQTNKKQPNTYIPQSVWLDNINWIIQNLKLFGYDMICIDGWGDDFTFTENGYRVKHSSNWVHDYQWWANYLNAKGVTLGIYNNPLWVNMQAVNQGKKIKGTNIPLENIVNRNEHAMFFNWVQIEKDGARQYIKGYVQYYADMGVKYLRVDFLSWFQDGKDRNPDLSRPIQRPRLYYQLALKWIKQACDANKMTFSLVMPHLYNYAEDELTFAGGSMIRINADVGDGRWQRFNNIQRGVMHQIWSTYDNAFDGFIYWSGLSGFASNKMILDGDFTRINTFANQQQKQTAISLQIISGGPLAITDQFNTIQNDLHYYQNSELLQLNYKLFVGKPLTRDLKNSRSQIWVGKTNNQEWIVGLFNRQNVDQLRSFNFQDQLGIAQGHVRDLWQHKDYGLKSSFNQAIKSHGCKIYKISQHTYQAQSPQFNLKGGSYPKQVTITLATKTLAASIYYTLNGEQPTSKSALYKQAIILKQNTYLKAMTIKEGIAYSFVVSNIYNISPQKINYQMCVGGTFTGWALPQMPMSYLGSNQWKSKYINLAKGTYEFKIANTCNWSKDDYGNAEGVKGFLKLTTQTPNNAKFTITTAGQYGFYFNEATLQYSIFQKVIG